jgi:hypothetical protein
MVQMKLDKLNMKIDYLNVNADQLQIHLNTLNHFLDSDSNELRDSIHGIVSELSDIFKKFIDVDGHQAEIIVTDYKGKIKLLKGIPLSLDNMYTWEMDGKAQLIPYNDKFYFVLVYGGIDFVKLEYENN